MTTTLGREYLDFAKLGDGRHSALLNPQESLYKSGGSTSRGGWEFTIDAGRNWNGPEISRTPARDGFRAAFSGSSYVRHNPGESITLPVLAVPERFCPANGTYSLQCRRVVIDSEQFWNGGHKIFTGSFTLYRESDSLALLYLANPTVSTVIDGTTSSVTLTEADTFGFALNELDQWDTVLQDPSYDDWWRDRNIPQAPLP
jgi:hypothetical protein